MRDISDVSLATVEDSRLLAPPPLEQPPAEWALNSNYTELPATSYQLPATSPARVAEGEVWLDLQNGYCTHILESLRFVLQKMQILSSKLLYVSGCLCNKHADSV